jgi:hypothetical protein
MEVTKIFDLNLLAIGNSHDFLISILSGKHSKDAIKEAAEYLCQKDVLKDYEPMAFYKKKYWNENYLCKLCVQAKQNPYKDLYLHIDEVFRHINMKKYRSLCIKTIIFTTALSMISFSPIIISFIVTGMKRGNTEVSEG